MKSPQLNVVTGAFSYTGKYITRRLLALGEGVRTFTGHPHRENPFGHSVETYPLSFDKPHDLTRNLQGASTLYNTYWVRFPHGKVTFHTARENTLRLLQAAEEAGVRRVVHVSITGASQDSPLPYFKGKGLVEEALVQRNLSYAILRPTVIFGTEDILINNIAWFLRRFPLFPIGGSGEYSVQPVYVEDLAKIAVSAGHQEDNLIVDAVGPETYTFDALVHLIAQKIGSRAKIIHVPPWLALFLARLIGLVVRDVILTQDEMNGLKSGLLVSPGRPTGETHLSQWLEQNSSTLGRRYASELGRHYRTNS